MTTLQRLAEDVFSEGAEYYWDGEAIAWWKVRLMDDGSAIYLSDFEMAQLNDEAGDLFDERIWAAKDTYGCYTSQEIADLDGPWREVPV